MLQFLQRAMTILAFVLASFAIAGCELLDEGETETKPIEFQTTDEHIQWRHEGEEEWQDLIALSELEGDDGISTVDATINEDGELVLELSDGETINVGEILGEDGRDVEFRVEDEEIQWRHEDDEWQKLIAVADLSGDDGRSAYEIYLDHHPDYEGDEETWLCDLVNGRLADKEEVVVSFDLGEAPLPENFEPEITVKRFTTLELPVPTWDYHAFLGWYSGFEVNDARFTNVSPVMEDITLQAKWEFQESLWIDDLNAVTDWEEYRDILFVEQLEWIDEEGLADYAVLRDIHANRPFIDKDAFDALFSDAMAFRMATRDAVAYANGLEEGDALDLEKLIMDVHTALDEGDLDHIHGYPVAEVLTHLENIHAHLSKEEDLEELVTMLAAEEITQYKDILAIIDDYLPEGIIVEEGDDLQVVIDAADPGDTIIVEPGVYAGALVITTADLTIRSSQGAAETVIDAEGENLALSIEASDIVFEGFTIENWELTGLTITEVQDIRIKDNHIEAGVSFLKGALYPVWIWDAENIEFSNNTVVVPTHDLYGSYGIVFEGVSDFNVSGNTFIGGEYPDDQYESHVGILVYNYLDDAMEGGIIEGNTFAGFEYAMQIALFEDYDVLDLVVKDNHLQNNDYGVEFVDWDYAGATVTFSTFAGNIFEANGIDVIDNSEHAFDLEAILAENTFIPEAVVEENRIWRAPATHTVEDGDDLQAAIDGAASRDIIEVGPGTYEGALTIDTEELSIIAVDGAEATTIDVEGAEVAIRITAANVVFEGFSVTNWSENYGVGIYVDAADGVNISENTINMMDKGTAIMVTDSSDTLIQNNTIPGFDVPDHGAYTGIYLRNYDDEPMVGTTMQENTIEGVQAGIVIDGLHDNDIVDIVLTDNHLEENLKGVFINASSPLDITIEFSQFTGNHFAHNDIQMLHEEDLDFDLDAILADNTFTPESIVDGNAIVPDEENDG